MNRKLESRVIHNCRSQICSQISHTSDTFVDIRYPDIPNIELPHFVINKLTPHGMLKKSKKFSVVNAN